MSPVVLWRDGSLREYAGAVARKWWAYIGVLLGIGGYLASLSTALVIPSWAWITLSVGSLAAAQFAAFRDVRSELIRATEKPPPMAIWAWHSTSASSDGAWLTAIIWGDGKQWDTGVAQRLVSAVLARLGLTESDVSIELFADALRVKTPKGGFTSDVYVQVGERPPTVLWQFRTDQDPVDFVWLLDRLTTAVGFAQSDLGTHLIAAGPRRRMMFGLSNWPAGGVSKGLLGDAKRPFPADYLSSNRVVSPHYVVSTLQDVTNAVTDFCALVLRGAGWVDFEADLTRDIGERVSRLSPN